MFLILLPRTRPPTRSSSTPTPQSCSVSPAFLYTTPTRAHHRCDYLSLSMYLLANRVLLLPFTLTLSLVSSLWEHCSASVPQCPHTFLRSTIFARQSSLLHLPTALPSFPSMGE